MRPLEWIATAKVKEEPKSSRVRQSFEDRRKDVSRGQRGATFDVFRNGIRRAGGFRLVNYDFPALPASVFA
jgi:hypothetical protein